MDVEPSPLARPNALVRSLLATGEVRLYGGNSAEMAAHVISSYAIPDGRPGAA